VDGVIGGIAARAGESVKVQGVVAYVLEEGEEPPAAEAADGPVSAVPASPPAVAPAPPPVAIPPAQPVRAVSQPPPVAVQAARPADGRIKASPLAKRLATEFGVDIAVLQGSGPGGRIVAKDVRAGADGLRVAAPVPAAAPAAAAAVPLAGMRKVIADRMMQSLSTMAQLTLVTEVDATRFVELRTDLASQHEDALGFRISFNDLLARIVTRALVEHPHMNASFNGEEIVQNEHVNIGLAVEVPDGLVVPNVKAAQNMQLVELASAFRKLIADIAGGDLNLNDLSGGTFTITNLGALGVDAFTPVINPPECAILGVGRIVAKPAVVDGEIAVRQMMTLSLTFDHRLNDGAPAARFLQRISQLIEQPYLLI
jgi:pyruvate dehydrogenase E2 component (dihydrolipoamide acetyltransferase)